MTIIRINALDVPAERGEELARRFAARAGAVDGAAGFEGFELLRPTDGRTQWLVVTRWADEGAYQAWLDSAAFGAGHGGGHGGGGHSGGGHSGGGHGGGGHSGGGHGGAQPPGAAPVSASEVWAYDVVELD